MKGMAKTKHFRTLVVSVAATLAACLMVLLLGARVTDAQASSPAYTVTDLGTLGGNYSYAYDINESGQVVGDSDGHAFLYDNGQMKNLGVLASMGGSSEAHGINDNGKVTGVSSADDPERGPGSVQHAFLYDSSQPNSQMQDLGYYPGNYPSSYGYAINNSDQIAGVTNGVRANLYQGGQWHDLGGGYQSYAYDINDSGAVVGRLETPVTYQGYHYTGIHAFLYQNGQIQDIDGSSSLRSEALGINDDGWITGFRRDNSTGDYQAFLWTPSGGIQDLREPEGVYPQSFGTDINNDGQIVGSVGYPESAALYENGQWKFLNALIPADSGWNLQSAQAINDKGQIVGYGTINRETHAFLLTPGSSTPSDTTKPTITVNSPIEGATYKLGESVTADYSCSDVTSSGSDLSCTGSVPSGSALDTSSVGPKTFTVTSTDKAGNTETKTVNYSVIYDFSGFFQPVDNLPTFNKTKPGKTIPVRFGLGGNQGTDIFADGYPKSAPVACNSTAPVDGIEETVLGKQGLTYDPVSNRYTYDWATSSGWSGCRQLVVKFKDDTVQRANFTFR